MKSFKLLSIATVVGSMFLVGCATNGSYVSAEPGYNSGYQTSHNGRGHYQENVRYGVVQSVRQVALNSGTSGAGIGIGAVAGGILGNQIGGGSGRTAATVLGAVGGGLLGNEIEKRNYSQSAGLEIQVRLERSGETMTVIQPDQGQRFSYGSRVRVVQDNGQWIVTR